MEVVGWAGSRGMVGGVDEEAEEEGVAVGVVSVTSEWEARFGAILENKIWLKIYTLYSVQCHHHHHLREIESTKQNTVD